MLNIALNDTSFFATFSRTAAKANEVAKVIRSNIST